MFISHFNNKSIQSVKEHNENVSNLCAEYCKKIGFENTGKILGLLHDIGKYSDNFQKYIAEAKQHVEMGDYDTWIKTTPTIDHGKVGAMYLYDKYHNDKNYKIYVEILCIIIAYHHGGLNDFITPNIDFSTPFLDRIYNFKLDEDYKISIEKMKKDIDFSIIDDFFQKGYDEYSNFLKLNKKEYIFFLILMLYSCLIDADRIDTQSFMDNIDINKFDTKTNYNNAISNLSNYYNNLKKGSKKTKINKLRNDIYDECYKASKNKSGTYTLTVPTGGSKTLSSLNYALNHNKEFNKDYIFYILPYTTIIEQNAEIYRKILGNENVFEHHSNILEENKFKLNEFLSEKDSYSLISHRWNTPLTVTTLVQFLETPFTTKTSNIRRFHSLINSTIIFDEIQSLPINCIGPFNMLCNFLKDICNTNIILCSATQPAFNFIEFKNILFKLKLDGEIISNPNYYYNEFKRVNIINALKKDGYDNDDIKEIVNEIMLENNNLLIIMNTKKTAEKVFDIISSQGIYKNIYYLSTNLAPVHRKNIIKEIKEKLLNKEQVICVSTQLIEAGVDISFECNIRNICGADSAAQAGGRCNRNGEKEIGKTYLINIKGEKLGNLKEIKVAEKIVENMLKVNPAIDLLEIDSIKNYFLKFHGELNECDMLYKIDCEIGDKDKNTLCELSLLSKDKHTKMSKKIEKNKEKYNLRNVLTYPFRTILSQFKVINQNTYSVIVPYKESINMISDLLSNITISEKIEIIKKIQQYSINIYSNKFEEFINNKIITKQSIGSFDIYILNENYYDEIKGFVEEPILKTTIF